MPIDVSLGGLTRWASMMAIALSLPVLACQQNVSAGGVGENESAENVVYRLDGRIDQAAVDRFRTFLEGSRSGPLTVVVRSAGGDGPAALDFGELIKSAHAAMIVDSYCVSYCAQALIPAAHDVTVEPGAVVVFHWSASDIQLPRSAAASLRGELENFREREDNFYRENGINPVDMRRLRHQVLPICTIDNVNLPNSRLDRYGTANRLTGVTPSLDLLRSIGFRGIRGSWPTNQQELQDNIDNAGFNSRFHVLFLNQMSDFDFEGERPLC